MAISVRILPADAAPWTASASIFPATVSEKAAIASPNGTIIAAKSSRSLSPKIAPSQPPLFGIVLDISVSILPAFAAASTASPSIFPLTVSEKVAIASPNGIICSAKSAKDFFPKRKPIALAMLSIKLALVSANIASASALAPSIAEASIFFAESTNG